MSIANKIITDIWARWNSDFNNCDVCSNEETEIAKKVTKTCQKSVEYFLTRYEEKYKWHNLRKNPNDLPPRDGNDESDYILCMIGKPEWNCWEQAYYNHAKGVWSVYDDVFAWRYIEPFEEKSSKKVISREGGE